MEGGQVWGQTASFSALWTSYTTLQLDPRGILGYCPVKPSAVDQNHRGWLYWTVCRFSYCAGNVDSDENYEEINRWTLRLVPESHNLKFSFIWRIWSKHPMAESSNLASILRTMSIVPPVQHSRYLYLWTRRSVIDFTGSNKLRPTYNFTTKVTLILWVKQDH